MPILRPCTHRGCRTLIPHGQRRCPTHPLEPRGWQHQKMRAQVVGHASRCHTCGCAPSEGNKLTLGHRVARAHGGTLTPTNLIAQCERCNYANGTREVTNTREDTGGGYPGIEGERDAIPHPATFSRNTLAGATNS